MTKTNNNNFVTKKDLIKTMVGFSESILNGIQKMFDEQNKRMDGMDKRFDGMDKRFDGMDKRFDGIDYRLDRLEVNMSEVKDEIKGLKADISTTVNKKEFNELKNRVDIFLDSN